MNINKNKTSDQITVTVFKDNHAARTFQVSLSWLSRLGLIGGSMIAMTLISAFFAAKYYRLAKVAHLAPSAEAEVKNLTLPTPLLSAAPQPVPTVTVTVNANSPATGTATSPSGSSLLFGALPAGTQLIQDPSKVQISIDTPRFSWNGKVLKTHFSIQYIREDHGSQNGKIVLLARGPRALLAYPEEVFNKADQGALIDPTQGEYFSVGRFREVKAEFGPAKNLASLKELEIILFNQNSEIILHQVVPIRASESSHSSSQTTAQSPAATHEVPAQSEQPKPEPSAQ